MPPARPKPRAMSVNGRLGPMVVAVVRAEPCTSTTAGKRPSPFGSASVRAGRVRRCRHQWALGVGRIGGDRRGGRRGLRRLHPWKPVIPPSPSMANVATSSGFFVVQRNSHQRRATLRGHGGFAAPGGFADLRRQRFPHRLPACPPAPLRPSFRRTSVPPARSRRRPCGSRAWRAIAAGSAACALARQRERGGEGEERRVRHVRLPFGKVPESVGEDTVGVAWTMLTSSPAGAAVLNEFFLQGFQLKPPIRPVFTSTTRRISSSSCSRFMLLGCGVMGALGITLRPGLKNTISWPASRISSSCR